MFKPRHLQSGEWGEKQAEKFLKEKKFKILGRRVKMPPHDEIDLVARDGKVLVFIEVKTRRTEAFGRPLAAVDKRKRRALCRAAVRYVGKLKDPRIMFRFDVVEIVGEIDGSKPIIRHIENAFQLDRKYILPC